MPGNLPIRERHRQDPTNQNTSLAPGNNIFQFQEINMTVANRRQRSDVGKCSVPIKPWKLDKHLGQGTVIHQYLRRRRPAAILAHTGLKIAQQSGSRNWVFFPHKWEKYRPFVRETAQSGNTATDPSEEAERTDTAAANSEGEGSTTNSLRLPEHQEKRQRGGAPRTYQHASGEAWPFQVRPTCWDGRGAGGWEEAARQNQQKQ
ncbi:hypothetical protein NDU88_010104 [Pleurodeles waltl]|uniref:Uncharacterized protein n=1 Tax=Pleurodeles waltl TaxID=8319 RepID=A0AAV7PX02_PLEWA|nr:hypothetical protein NDU88_010104 [Pleurodeles waltl]